MANCYYCNIAIDRSNESLEHIFPNSIGGRLKSKELLCRECNNHLGSTIDAELGKQFANLVALLGLDRERAKEYIIKNVEAEDKEKYHLVDGRRPVMSCPKIITTEKGITIAAPNDRQLRQAIAGQKRKHPNLILSDLEKSKKYIEYFFDSTLNIDLSIGGDELLKAIGKIAVSAFLHMGGRAAYSKSIVGLIKGETKNEKHIHFHHLPEEIVWNGEEIVHFIRFRGIKERRILFAYIVLFSTYAYIVNFDDDYVGEDFESNYGFDINGGKEVNKCCDVHYWGRKAYLKYLVEGGENEANRKIIESIESQLNRLVQIFTKKHRAKGIVDVINETTLEVLRQYPLGTEMTEEIRYRIINTAAPKIRRLILYWRGESIEKC